MSKSASFPIVFLAMLGLSPRVPAQTVPTPDHATSPVIRTVTGSHADTVTNAVAGSVTAAEKALLGTSPVSSGTTVYSGELLRTASKGMLQLQVGHVQITLFSDSSMRAFRDDDRLRVELERGSLSFSTSGHSEELSFYSLDVKFTPKTTVPASGTLKIVSSCEVRVTSTRGKIDVYRGEESNTVEESKGLRVFTETSVSYKNDWKPIIPEYPAFDSKAEYHRSHLHVACAASPSNPSSPHPPVLRHFAPALLGGGVGVAIWPIIEATESPDRP